MTANLRAELSASASLLELGKSLALDCTVTGYPIHQVVFKHNQNIIKSITGTAAATSTSHPHYLSTTGAAHYAATSSHRNKQQPVAGSYFVVDSSSSSSSPSSSRSSGTNELVATDTQLPLASQMASSNNELAAGAEQQPINSAEQEDPDTTDQTKLSHVIVIVLEPQHAGAYQCFAYNQYESVQSSAYIRVLDDPPKFKDTFRAQVFEQRDDISLQCSARANPLPEITWSVDGQPIPESARTRFGDFVSKDNLVISYVNISGTQVSDSGQYKCTADNGLAQVSHQAQVSVAGPVQIKPMANITVVASTTFRIRCPVAGHPVQDIQWLHNGRRLPANHRQHVYDNGTLEVEHMEKSQADDGEYTCMASAGPISQQQQQPGAGTGLQQESPTQIAYGSLFVSIKVRPTIEPFTISRSLREGQRASIMCTISSGDLPISISWFRNDQPIVVVTSNQQGDDQQVRHQQAFQSSMDELPGGQQQLLALGSPQVGAGTGGQQLLSSNGYVTGDSSHASSSSLEFGAAVGSQYRDLLRTNNNNNGSLLLSGVRISRVSDYSSTLLFESLLAQHSANYTCLARNDAGSVSHQAPMIVQGKCKLFLSETLSGACS